MNSLIPVEYNNQRILTTRQLSDGYDTEPQIITNNFNRNKSRYQEGKHYHALEGEAKREFLDQNQIDVGSKNAAILYLWTEKGALLHAKSLNTDRAWEVYDELVESYFRPKNTDLTLLSPDLQMFKCLFDSMAASQLEHREMRRQLAAATEKVEATAQTLTIIKEAIISRDEDWRNWINTMFNKAVLSSPGKDFKALRSETYEELQRRARCRLNVLLTNLKNRLAEQGISKTKIAKVSRLDVIENDVRLKEIYTAIVKELAIRYTA